MSEPKNPIRKQPELCKTGLWGSNLEMAEPQKASPKENRTKLKYPGSLKSGQGKEKEKQLWRCKMYLQVKRKEKGSGKKNTKNQNKLKMKL